MRKLDDMIQEALETQEIDLPQEYGYFELGLAQFSGKLGWVTWVIMLVQLILFVTGVYCAMQFFQASEVLPALRYGISGGVLLLAGLALKLSLVPQMQADRVLRELKRLELILAMRKS